ncbi:GrpB family protein [Paenibacillus chibensis]|uniref:GrpB family protein n=1 Tax=Paenibacillus chibensis TaxID=59846 RepID=A0ABU6PSK9_9BACL|nr:GrpB family protein [Paenibacillus chibensis]
MEQVNIAEYNPEWAAEYEQEKTKITQALQDILLGMEHIGSTSVPGLGAKPIIDMMAGIRDLEELKPFHIERLAEIGYEYVEHAHFPERRFFRRGQWRAGTHHLHIYAFHGEHWNQQLLFRNYLLTHPDAVEEYLHLKKNMAELYPNDRAKYTEAKAPFIQSILQEASKMTKGNDLL